MKEFKDRAALLKEYLKQIKAKGGRSLTWEELKDAGITRAQVRTHFTNKEALDAAARKTKPTHFKDVALTALKGVEDVKSRSFVITTAAMGCDVHLGFLKALRRYADDHNAEILVLPCADPASKRSPNGQGKVDKRLLDYGCTILPYQDLQLNENLKILGVRLSAKQIKPLTGLPRFGNRGVSLIAASPKQSLEFVATMGKHPHAVMTTGAITVPDYRSDAHRSHRTAYLAEQDHVVGAILVEIESPKIFHFRHVKADDKGGFYDWGRYHSTRASKEVHPEALVMGDLHSWILDSFCFNFITANTFRARDLVLHDSFDGATRTLNHHASKNKAALDDPMSPLFIEDELNQWASNMCDFSHYYRNIYIVRSNHDERVDRYINEGRFLDDSSRNKRTAHKLWGYMLDGIDPLEGWFREQCPKIKNVIFLDRHTSFKIAGVELGNHGDMGANGSRGGNLEAFDKALGSCIVGHSHTAGIVRNAMRVGHCCDLSRVLYTKGPSSWTKSHALLYPDGRKQLINMIDSDTVEE